ncbi:Ribosomal protein S18 acetylase RimI [Nocardioides terrae]|uniref:Ribosomal protein S18 acetylase RimI n=2 Tax=Nocardioides terrae TaxID=574651 RepID=A0A1I1GMU0_9ACTN|nr:GNAT family N-acetyltransferase [Nocardioides terrae]SFC12841.1 Ribosomal protein S18 acetylase RimI [Nocardioides terrae]
MEQPTLPEGYTRRPLALADAERIADVMGAEELLATGEVGVEAADLVADWSEPSYDLATHSVGVLSPDGDLVGYAEAYGGDRADAAVHPDHHGLGIGTALARWVVARAGELGADRVGMPNPVGSPGDRLLEALSWEARWTSWVLELPEGRTVPERPLPEGHTIREATGADYEQAWDVVESAFLEWSERPRQQFDKWLHHVLGRPGFEPWNLRVATDPDGAIVGVVIILLYGVDDPDGAEGFIEKVAVRRDRRGLGLGQALLAESFACARAHGAVRSRLSTDSRTGALSLYERVGMQVIQEWVNRAAPTSPHLSPVE